MLIKKMTSLPTEIYNIIASFSTGSKIRLIERTSSGVKMNIKKLISIDDIIDNKLYDKFYFENILIEDYKSFNVDYIVKNKVKTITFKLCEFNDLDLSELKNIKNINFISTVVKNIKVYSKNIHVISINSFINNNNYNFCNFNEVETNKKLSGNVQKLKIMDINFDVKNLPIEDLNVISMYNHSSFDIPRTLKKLTISELNVPNLKHTLLEFLEITENIAEWEVTFVIDTIIANIPKSLKFLKINASERILLKFEIALLPLFPNITLI
jgi:hypothetical protein